MTTLENLKKEIGSNIVPSLSLPCLKTDDGVFISSSICICRYIAYTYKPELMGKSEFEKA